jgi:hypothetical protein
MDAVAAEFGNADPTLLQSLLNVSEQFHLLRSFDLATALSCVNGTESFQNTFLTNPIVPLGPNLGGSAFFHTQLRTDGSWRAGPNAGCATLSALRRQPGGSEAFKLVDAAMSASVAQPNVRAAWDRDWDKGGSLASGAGLNVLVHAWPLEDSGRWITATRSLEVVAEDQRRALHEHIIDQDLEGAAGAWLVDSEANQHRPRRVHGDERSECRPYRVPRDQQYQAAAGRSGTVDAVIRHELDGGAAVDLCGIDARVGADPVHAGSDQHDALVEGIDPGAGFDPRIAQHYGAGRGIVVDIVGRGCRRAGPGRPPAGERSREVGIGHQILRRCRRGRHRDEHDGRQAAQ